MPRDRERVRRLRSRRPGPYKRSAAGNADRESTVIEFRCTCGKRLRVRDDLAGRPARCPACGAAIRVPTGAEAAVSGPEALQAALRDLQSNQADAAPVAETVDTPAELEEAAQGLDALARAAGGPRPARTAVGPSRGRRPARSAAPKRRGRSPTRQPERASAPKAVSGGKADAKRKQAMIVGGFAAVGVLLIIVIVALATRDNTPPPPPPDEGAAPTPVVETPRRRGPFTGHQPGELFDKVPFDGEQDEGGGEGG